MKAAPNKRKDEFEDDGRTIVNMSDKNLPGSVAEHFFSAFYRRSPRERMEEEKGGKVKIYEEPREPIHLTRGEYWHFVFNTWVAALLIAAVFFAVIGLFIYWLKTRPYTPAETTLSALEEQWSGDPSAIRPESAREPGQ